MLATISDIEVDLGEQEGNFDLTFGLWTDETYTETLPANTEPGFQIVARPCLELANQRPTSEHHFENQIKINVPAKLYIGAFIGTEGFYTRLDTCWATPSQGFNIDSVESIN